MKQPRSARPRRATLVSCAAVALAIVAYAVSGASAARFKGVAIEIAPTAEGLFLIQTKDLERRLDEGPFGPLLGADIDEVDIAALEAYLYDDPFVATAEVYVRYDGSVHVAVAQHEPLLRVHHRGGPDYYVSPDGTVLPLSKHAVARVPVLTGEVPSFEEAARDSLPIEAHALAVAVAADPLLAPLVEQIDVGGGEYTLVPKLGTGRYVLGALDDLDAKLHDLRAFVLGVYPEKGWDYYGRVDLRFDDLVFGTQPSA